MSYILLSFVFAAVFGVLVYGKEKGKVWNFLLPGIVFLILGLINYAGLPVLRLWGFHGVWVEFFFVGLVGFVLSLVNFDDGYDLFNKKNFRWWRAVPLGISLFAFLIMIGQSWECFHAGAFHQRLKVEIVSDSVFNHDVHPIPVSKMITVDETLARKVAEDKLGQDLGLGSRVEIGKMTIQQMTGEFVVDKGQKLKFDDAQIWVAPLEHRSFFKWLRNDVTPGYVIVDATDATKIYLVTELSGKPLALRYLENAFFADDIERHIKNNGYASKGLNDHCFEISPEGVPYWVLSSYEPTIGFKGEESEGVITVDAQTGELKSYSIAETPEWIDRIQPADFIFDQIRCYGEYGRGWWNSFWAQYEVQEPTPGISLVYSEGRSFWYTGIQSAGADNATNGFILVDTKTKAAKFYRVIGINELEARKIAEDQNFAKASGYQANDPILYNVRGVPTYFMTMKGQSGNVMGYCFVAVNNRQAVGIASSKTDAEQAYLRMLKKTSHDKLTDGPVQEKAQTFVVRDITLEGSTYYLLFEGVSGKEFTGSTEFYRELKWTKKGDKVSVVYGEGEGKVIPLDFFDNLDFEI